MQQLVKTAAAAVIAAAVSGGIALAAASPVGMPAAPGGSLPSQAASQAHEHAHKHGAKDKGKDKARGADHGRPNPSLHGLCHAWLAGAGSKHGKARTNPAFSVLVDAAGGVAQVPAFCDRLLASRPADRDDPDENEGSETPEQTPQRPRKPAHAGRPTDAPSTQHSAARPSSVPPLTGSPTG